MADDLKFEDYCQKCKNYDLSGVCRKIHFNVKDYPNKFKEKCSGNFFEIDEKKAQLLSVLEICDEKNIKHNSLTDENETRFKILSGYGSFIGIIGWIIILFGLFASIYASTELNYSIVIATAGFLIFFLAGINMIVFAELIKCFVSIESNTRQTSKLLNKNN